MTWFGFGVGLLVRNSPTTVSLLLLWPLLIEGLISVFLNLLNWEGAVKYLPYHAAISASVGNPDTDEARPPRRPDPVRLSRHRPRGYRRLARRPPRRVTR